MKCPQCSESVNGEDLELHLRRDLRYRAFECGICGLEFYSHSDAQAHFGFPMFAHRDQKKPRIAYVPNMELEKFIHKATALQQPRFTPQVKPDPYLQPHHSPPHQLHSPFPRFNDLVDKDTPIQSQQPEFKQPAESVADKWSREQEVEMDPDDSQSCENAEVADSDSETRETSSFLLGHSLFKPRQRAQKLTRAQTDILAHAFAQLRYPKAKERRLLEQATGLSQQVVYVWFQNRRAADKRNAKKLQECDPRFVFFQRAMICSLCSASVDSRAELELHLRRELRYRGFECGICGLLFYSEADALYHFRSPLSTHSGHRPEIVANPKPQLDARIAALLDSSTHSSDTDASPPTPLHSPSDSEDRPPSAVTTSAGSPVPFLMEDVSEAELPKLEESSDEEEQEEIDNVNMSLSHNQDTAKAKTPKRMTTPEEKEKLIAALEAGATGMEEARRMAKELDWPAIKVQRWFYKNKGGVTITKKGPNLGFSEEVKKAFNELYNVCPKPNLEQRLRLCKELGLNDKQVYNWFNSKGRYKKS